MSKMIIDGDGNEVLIKEEQPIQMIELNLTAKEIKHLQDKIIKYARTCAISGKIDLNDKPERLLIQLLTSLLIDQSAATAALIPYIINSPVMAQLPVGINLVDTYFFCNSMLHSLYNEDYPVDKLENIQDSYGIFEMNFPLLRGLFLSLPSMDIEQQIAGYRKTVKVKDEQVQ